MRLIDADALIEFCEERWIPLNIDAVNIQPTIQPVATDTNVGDLISRQKAIDAVEESRRFNPHKDSKIARNHEYEHKHFLKILLALPSARPDRRKGKWIRITQGAIPEQYMCPFCHRTVETYELEELLTIRYPFCHCGADMRGEQDE